MSSPESTQILSTGYIVYITPDCISGNNRSHFTLDHCTPDRRDRVPALLFRAVGGREDKENKKAEKK